MSNAHNLWDFTCLNAHTQLHICSRDNSSRVRQASHLLQKEEIKRRDPAFFSRLSFRHWSGGMQGDTLSRGGVCFLPLPPLTENFQKNVLCATRSEDKNIYLVRNFRIFQFFSNLQLLLNKVYTVQLQKS